MSPVAPADILLLPSPGRWSTPAACPLALTRVGGMVAARNMAAAANKALSAIARAVLLFISELLGGPNHVAVAWRPHRRNYLRGLSPRTTKSRICGQAFQRRSSTRIVADGSVSVQSEGYRANATNPAYVASALTLQSNNFSALQLRDIVTYRLPFLPPLAFSNDTILGSPS